ncbi:MAG: hypothetical protein R2695_03430 [Acidimicrobiales bacterium]
MHDYDDLPVPPGPDPIDDADPQTLRVEILRLRDAVTAAYGRLEVARDRIAELEERERALADDNEHLHRELAKNPILRVARAVGRRVRPRP